MKVERELFVKALIKDGPFVTVTAAYGEQGGVVSGTRISEVNFNVPEHEQPRVGQTLVMTIEEAPS